MYITFKCLEQKSPSKIKQNNHNQNWNNSDNIINRTVLDHSMNYEINIKSPYRI